MTDHFAENCVKTRRECSYQIEWKPRITHLTFMRKNSF